MGDPRDDNLQCNPMHIYSEGLLNSIGLPWKCVKYSLKDFRNKLTFQSSENILTELLVWKHSPPCMWKNSMSNKPSSTWFVKWDRVTRTIPHAPLECWNQLHEKALWRTYVYPVQFFEYPISGGQCFGFLFKRNYFFRAIFKKFWAL